jgi:hypothetical protein
MILSHCLARGHIFANGAFRGSAVLTKFPKLYIVKQCVYYELYGGNIDQVTVIRMGQTCAIEPHRLSVGWTVYVSLRLQNQFQIPRS